MPESIEREMKQLPPLKLSSNSDIMEKIPEIVIAAQLTLLCHEYFSRIQVSDLFNRDWETNPGTLSFVYNSFYKDFSEQTIFNKILCFIINTKICVKFKLQLF